MNQNNSKRPDINGTSYTVNEDGSPVPPSEDRAEEGVFVQTNRRGAYVTEDNPFLFETVRDMKTRQQRLTVKRGTPVTIEGGEEGVTTVEQLKPIDQKTFVKVFSGADFKDVYNLTAPGLKMYLVVLEILGDVSAMNKVHIRLTTQMAKNLTSKSTKPLSKTTIDRGIKDLIDKGYISGATINGETEGWYWINPQRFFNGDTVVIKQIYKLSRETRDEKMRVNLPSVPAETIIQAMRNRPNFVMGEDAAEREDDE